MLAFVLEGVSSERASAISSDCKVVDVLSNFVEWTRGLTSASVILLYRVGNLTATS